MSLSKEALLEKLGTISALYKKAVRLKEKMDTFEPEDRYKRKVKVPVFPGKYEDDDEREEWESCIDHTDDDAIEQMSEAYDDAYAPQKPTEKNLGEFKYSGDAEIKNKEQKFGCFSYIAGGAAIFCLLSLILGTADGAVGAIIVLAIAAAALCVFFRYKIKLGKEQEKKNEADARVAYEARKEKFQEAYHKEMQAYESAYAEHEANRQAFLNDYTAWRKIYLESVAEEEEIDEKLEADREAAVSKINEEEFAPAMKELNGTNDLVADEYLAALDILIDLLESGRADDLKEAINLFEELVYRERQLQLQREQEEQRRREEEQRRREEERRYQEQMEFQREQERERRYEERMAEYRHEEQMKLQKEQEFDRQRAERIARETQQRKEWQAEQDRKKAEETAIRRQCNSCALAGRCSLSYTRANCASYRPR